MLRKLGILEDIMKKINPDEVKNRGFRFYDGTSDSPEHFYEVYQHNHPAAAGCMHIADSLLCAVSRGSR